MTTGIVLTGIPSMPFGSGSAAAPSITFSTDGTSGFFLKAGSSLGISTGGTEVGSVTSGAWILGPANVAATNGVLFTINTGDQGTQITSSSVGHGQIVFGNLAGGVAVPCIAGGTSDAATGLELVAYTPDTNASVDMIFSVRDKTSGTGHSDGSRNAYGWYGNAGVIGTVTRGGVWTLGPTPGAVTTSILRVNTGTSGTTSGYSNVDSGQIAFSNGSSTQPSPVIMGRSDGNRVGLTLVGYTTDANTLGDIGFETWENDGTVHGTLTRKAFYWYSGGAEIANATRAGAWEFGNSTTGVGASHTFNALQNVILTVRRTDGSGQPAINFKTGSSDFGYIRMSADGAFEVLKSGGTYNAFCTTGGAWTLGPEQSLNYLGPVHQIAGHIASRTPTSGASSDSGYMIISANYKDAGYGNRYHATPGGVGIVLRTQTTAANAALSFRTNKPGDSVGTAGVEVGFCTHEGAWTFGPSVSLNWAGVIHKISGHLAVATPTAPATDESGFMVISTNLKFGTYGNRFNTSTGGAGIMFDTRTADSGAALAFYANQVGDTTGTEADEVGRVTHAGSWTLGVTSAAAETSITLKVYSALYQSSGGQGGVVVSGNGRAILTLSATSGNPQAIQFRNQSGTQAGFSFVGSSATVASTTDAGNWSFGDINTTNLHNMIGVMKVSYGSSPYIRTYSVYGGTIGSAIGSTYDLFQNANSYSDLSFMIQVKVFHSAITHIYTFGLAGGYGWYPGTVLTNTGYIVVEAVSVSTGYYKVRLRVVSTLTSNGDVYIGAILFGHAPVTVLNGQMAN